MLLLYYLIIINLVAAVLFIHDKHRARRNRTRVPEKVLHLTELLGGVIITMPLMYIIRHKNRKRSYYIITYLIFLAWAVFLTYLAVR